MAIRVQRHANVSKQKTLLDGVVVSPLKWRVYGCGLNRFVHEGHEGMNHISNVDSQRIYIYIYIYIYNLALVSTVELKFSEETHISVSYCA